MKRTIIILSVFVIFAFVLNAQPRLTIVGGDTVNWGKVRLDQSPVKKKLILYNSGDKKLIFKKVMPSCGCTTAPIDKDTLNPGDTATIDITFNLPNFAGMARKALQIKTNDPLSKNRIVYLFADVVFPLKFFPSQAFFFQGLLAKDTMTSKVVITNTTDRDIIVKQVKISPSFCTTNLKNDMVIPANGDITVNVFANPSMIGMVKGELVFKTTHPDVVRVKIPIIMNIVGEQPEPPQKPKY